MRVKYLITVISFVLMMVLPKQGLKGNGNGCASGYCMAKMTYLMTWDHPYIAFCPFTGGEYNCCIPCGDNNGDGEDNGDGKGPIVTKA